MTTGRRLLLFLVGGALLFAAQHAWRQRQSTAEYAPVAITAADVDSLRRGHVTATGREPSGDELRVLIDAEIEEELLYRAARALALGRQDRVVRQRLIRNMRFLEDTVEDDSGGAVLLRDALELGIDDHDLVVRRRLVQRLRLAIVAAARSPEPSDAELHAYLNAHADRYRASDRVRVSVLFFDPDVGDAGPRARAALEQLRGNPQAAVDTLADPAAVASQGLYAERELAKLYGREFTRAVFALPVGEWSGPLSSSLGSNLVWVEERVEGALPVLADVRSVVRDAILEERGRLAVRLAIDELRLRYPVATPSLPMTEP